MSKFSFLGENMQNPDKPAQVCPTTPKYHETTQNMKFQKTVWRRRRKNEDENKLFQKSPQCNKRFRRLKIKNPNEMGAKMQPIS